MRLTKLGRLIRHEDLKTLKLLNYAYTYKDTKKISEVFSEGNE
jgi:hypothetical protein